MKMAKPRPEGYIPQKKKEQKLPEAVSKSTRSVIIVALAIILLAVCGNAAFGQSYSQEGNVFKTEKTVESQPDELTPFFYEVKEKINDETIVKNLPIYITKRNACYVIRTSKKTGKLYKQYLPKDLSAEITKQLGRTAAQKLD